MKSEYCNLRERRTGIILEIGQSVLSTLNRVVECNVRDHTDYVIGMEIHDAVRPVLWISLRGRGEFV